MIFEGDCGLCECEYAAYDCEVYEWFVIIGEWEVELWMLGEEGKFIPDWSGGLLNIFFNNSRSTHLSNIKKILSINQHLADNKMEF